MPEEAVLDAPDLATPDLSAEAPVESEADASPAVDAPESGESQAEGDAAPPVSASVPATLKDGKVKAAIDKLYAEGDKDTAARIRNTLARQEAFIAEFPGGLKEAKSLKAIIEDIGGEDGIRETRDTLSEFQALDESYKKGDAGFVNTLATSNPEAFAKLAPQVADKWSSEDPDGFTGYVSRVMLNHMLSAKVDQRLFALEYALGENADPRIKAALDGIKKYFSDVEEFAKLQSQPKQKPAVAPEAQEYQKRAETAERGTFSTRGNVIHNSLFEREFSRLSNGKTIPAEARMAIQAIYRDKIRQATAAKKNFNSTVEKYFSSRDMKGYERYLESHYKEALPRALESAFNAVVKPGRAPATQTSTPRPVAKAPKPDNGFEWVQKAPNINDISPRTTPDMSKQGKAILRNGKMVQWATA